MKVAEAREKWLAMRAEIEKEPADKDTYELVRIMDGVFTDILPDPAAQEVKKP